MRIIKYKKYIKGTWLISTLAILMSMCALKEQKVEIQLMPAQGILRTIAIQNAIDSCALSGGGTVILSSGVFLTGGLQLKSNVTIRLGKGAILLGSDNYLDYGKGAWSEGLITADDAYNIAIEGDGVIDGVECRNPQGEEGFRGPHAIRLTNCKNIRIEGITIQRSANWAINCRYCEGGNVTNVKIRGGHDGLHTRFCNDFTISGCDFRTGDDAFAGNDNKDFSIIDCLINTSCNGFRIGCLNLTVKDCKLWGPGEYRHKIQNRSNMLSAFVHFSPKDEKSQLTSGNWNIENLTIDQVDRFYVYNFENGLWQTGQPATTISFKNIQATNILTAFSIIGDTERQFSLRIAESDFAFREGADEPPVIFEGADLKTNAFFSAKNFNDISLTGVRLQKKSSGPLLECSEGGILSFDRVKVLSSNPKTSTLITGVEEIDTKTLKTIKLN